MTAKPLIVMALESEAQGYFEGLPVVFTGVGKVNPTYHLTKAIAKNRPSHVINLGSAGSQVFKAGTLVNCTQFVERDMDASPLGFDPYLTPYEEEALLNYGQHYPDLAQGICGTGDSFYTDGHHDDFNLVDMEAYALAKICQQENITFTCIKFITDGADGQASDDWSAALLIAAQKLREVYDQIT